MNLCSECVSACFICVPGEASQKHKVGATCHCSFDPSIRICCNKLIRNLSACSALCTEVIEQGLANTFSETKKKKGNEASKFTTSPEVCLVCLKEQSEVLAVVSCDICFTGS